MYNHWEIILRKNYCQWSHAQETGSDYSFNYPISFNNNLFAIIGNTCNDDEPSSVWSQINENQKYQCLIGRGNDFVAGHLGFIFIILLGY